MIAPFQTGGLGVTPSSSSNIYSQTLTLIAAMAIKPSAIQQANINTLVKTLVDGGVWSLLDTLWIPAQHDQQAARLNWINPSTFPLIENTKTGPGSGIIPHNVTFTKWKGYDGGLDSYLGTGWSYSTSSVNFTQNSASSFFFTDTNINDGALAACGSIVNTSNLFFIKDGSVFLACVNSSTGVPVSVTSTNITGLFAANRSGAGTNTTKIYINGSNVATGGDASGVLQNIYDYILAEGNASNGSAPSYAALFLSANRCQARGLGASLNSTQHAVLSSALTTYIDNLSAISASEDTANTYIMLAGQSNACDNGFTSDEVFLSPVIDSVKSYYNYYWQPYQAGVTSYNTHSAGGVFGTGASMAYRLRNTYNKRNLYLLNTAVGGSSLSSAGGSNSWDPATPSNRYRDMLYYWSKAIKALNDTNPKLFVVWIQGEGDMPDAPSLAAYGTNGVNLINTWRSDTGLSSSQLIFIIVKQGLNASFYNTNTQINPLRTAQDYIAANCAGVYTVEASTQYVDGVHHTSAGYVDQGNTVADLIQSLM